jgi:hypothetical protein
MREASSSTETGYRAIPIAEPWGDAYWRAGVLLSADEPRGDRPAKSLSPRLFGTREDAMHFAESEYGRLGR